jgi:flavin-binding protein dodecin
MVCKWLLESLLSLFLESYHNVLWIVVKSSTNEAKKTIHGITGIVVGDMTAKVDPSNGNITEYHTAVKIAFGIEH